MRCGSWWRGILCWPAQWRSTTSISAADQESGQMNRRRGRGRKGQANTEKTPVLGMVQRPADAAPGTPAGDARAAVVTGLSLRAAERAIKTQIDPDARLMSDEGSVKALRIMRP